jgi:3'-5' exoribonuclease
MANEIQNEENPASLEQVRKVYAKDLREKDRVHTVFRVTQKSRVTARSGKVFLSAVLADKSGEVDARVFERADELDAAFASGDYLLVEGNVIAFHGKPQVVIEKLEKLDPEPLDPKEFEPPPAPPAQAAAPAAPQAPAAAADGGAPQRSEAGGARSVGQIREIVEQRIQDPHVKALLLAFLDDPEISAALPQAPAAKGIHHAYRGGLADHLLSVMRLTLRVADHYPMADRDLLLAGALLHDVMKVKEISSAKGFDYTDEGRLVGHLVMTAQKIREKTLQLPGFPPLLEQHLTHLVLAHHGQLEYGSPKLPLTIEAHIVHALDSLDSRIASWTEAMARDPNERWTEPLRHYDRSLWKGPVPTVRGKAPVEGRRGKRADGEPRRKGKGQPQQQAQGGAATAAAAEAGAPQAPREERPPRRERPPREDRPPREERGAREDRPPREPRPPRGDKPGGAPKELTFKPFSALTGELQAPKPAEESSASAPESTPDSAKSE